MARREARLKDGIEAVAIVTPNHMHFPVAKAFLKRGIHVICDKPLTANLRDAKKLAELVRESGRVFALTHNYTGYPMVRQAREMVAAGELGEIRLVHAEYVQDWLTTDIETTGQKQAEWRTDPARSGVGGAVGDIGTHAYNLACFVSGIEAETLSADLTSFVEGRELDDNVHVMLRYAERRARHAVGEPGRARATRTGWCCACTARRRASNGRRRTRTTSGSGRSASRSG